MPVVTSKKVAPHWSGNREKENWLKYNLCMLTHLRLRLDGRHFPDDSLKWIFLNENLWALIRISLTFVPGGPIKNIPALVQIMAWHRPWYKPLSEPMLVSLPMHICVTQPQLVNAAVLTYNEYNFSLWKSWKVSNNSTFPFLHGQFLPKCSR